MAGDKGRLMLAKLPSDFKNFVLQMEYYAKVKYA